MRKHKKGFKIPKKEKLFDIISIVMVLTIGLYFGIRLIYFYNQQNSLKKSVNLVDKVLSKQSLKSKNGLKESKDGYYFYGNVSNNYVMLSNKLYQILKIDNNNNIKLVTAGNAGILIWGDDVSYKKSNLYTWLNKTSDGKSGIYYDTISATTFLEKTYYKENSLINAKIKVSKQTLKDYVSTITLDDYVNAGGRKSFLNIKKCFWLIGHDKDNANLYVDNEGSLQSGSNYDSYGIRPVITIKGKVVVTGGAGTLKDPYVVQNENNTNDTDSYVKLGNDVWKVYNDDGKVLKMSLNGYLNVNGSEYKASYSTTNISFNISNRRSVGYYLNNTYYNSLSYNKYLVDGIYYTGEVSNSMGLSINNVYADSVTCKVGLLGMFDYNSSDLSDYYLINTTSTTNTLGYVYNNIGMLDENKVTEEKHIVPVVSINKTSIKNGKGTLSDPYTVE